MNEPTTNRLPVRITVHSNVRVLCLYVDQAIKRLIKDSTKHADAMRELTDEVRASRKAAVAEDRKLDSLFGPMRTKQQELRDELEREKVGTTN